MLQVVQIDEFGAVARPSERGFVAGYKFLALPNGRAIAKPQK